jgi:hypothetical protein
MANGSEDKNINKKELVSRKVFMARLGINNRTMFTLLRNGTLVVGRDFIIFGGHHLYLWQDDLHRPGKPYKPH